MIIDVESVSKIQIPTIAKTLTSQDISYLVNLLQEKNDKKRYNAFLLLQAHSRLQPSIYAHWDTLESKLDSDNSYQRSLGLMLIAENVRWDKEGKFKQVIGKYFRCCNDEKFITSRQAIQGLQAVIEATNKYNSEIAQRLRNVSLIQYKDNQRSLLNKDIAKILALIER